MKLSLACALFLVAPARAQMPGVKTPRGVVPDAKTAIRIAIAVWSPIYGEREIQNEKPFHARLKNGVWFVNGSLPKGAVGGTAEIEIARRDGRVLRIWHGK